MEEITITPVAAEPEEAIEAALCALLAASCTVPVEGAVTPASVGSVKTLDEDTFVAVSVDQSSQDIDARGSRVPHTYAARVVVRVALADDPTSSMFRDECRIVRAVLATLTGDGCMTLGADGFACDAFVLDSTTTTFEPGENPVRTKAYTATLKGRTITTTEAN